LAGAVADSVGIVIGEADGLVLDTLDIIGETLASGESVKIHKFGTFTVRDKKARMGRNPSTGEPSIVPAMRSASWSPSPLMRRFLKDCQSLAKKPRDTGVVQMKRTSSKEAFRSNVTARLEALGVTAYTACVAHDKKGGWLTDLLRRSPRGVPLDVKDEVADMLGVARFEIDRPKAPMSLKTWPEPAWVEGAKRQASEAKSKAAKRRSREAQEAQAARMRKAKAQKEAAAQA
jgi:integration host factor subunit alpha